VGRVLIRNEDPIGTRYGPWEFQIPLSGDTNANTPWLCGSGSSNIVYGNMLQGTETSNKIFTTNVKGVGIRLSRYFSGGGSDYNYYPHTRTGPFGAFQAGSKFVVELFKLEAETGDGPLAQGTYTTYSGADGKSVLTTFLSGEGITIITPTCSVDAGSKNILVDFGKVPLSGFKGKGSTAGDRAFSIKLNCKAGRNTQNTIYMRMDARQDPSNETGVLQVTQGTQAATGVGIQVIDKNAAPVKWGDNLLVGTSKDGSYVLPFTGRYYQTADKVTPGKGDGMATFTLDYK
jgi:type 1 fimbria pilin